MTESTAGAWRKSTYSETGTCVEVRRTTGGVHVRDSVHPDGPYLHFGLASWAAFLAWTIATDHRLRYHHSSDE